MRARKEERNQAMLEDRKNGMMVKDIAKKYGLCQGRTTTILQNQARWNEEKDIQKNIPKRMNHDELIQYIEDHRRK